MKPIETWRQRQVLNFWLDFRAAYGVSPTFDECGMQMDPKHPLGKGAVQRVVIQLGEMGWLVNTGAKVRNWVPSQEARLWERWGEVLGVVKRAAEKDPMAAEIMSYVMGNGGHRAHPMPTKAKPVESEA